MNDELSCGHLTDCMDSDGNCKWCHDIEELVAVQIRHVRRIDDLERDNKSLTAVLDKKAVRLFPGDHRNLDVRTIGHLVMYPGATMHCPDDRTVLNIQSPPKAETPAESEPYKTLANGRRVRRAGADDREPCPECSKLSEVEKIGALPIQLSCGCETRNLAWLNRAYARFKIPTEVAAHEHEPRGRHFRICHLCGGVHECWRPTK